MTAMSEPLDIEEPDAFRGYLARTGLIAAGEPCTPTALPGGVSSRTVLVRLADGRGFVFKQALPKLRVAVDWFSDPVRVHREAQGLRTLGELAPPGTVPAAVHEDFHDHVVGMEAVPQPHANWKSLLLAGRLETDHVRQFGRWLGTVHRESWRRRDELSVTFDDRSFFESLRIEPYYQYTASQVPEAAGFLTDLIASTRSRRLALVHGDFSPKNVLVHDGRLVLLDFEVIHWGDPAFDLGFGLTHLLSKARHVRPLRAEFSRAASEFFDTCRNEVREVPWSADVEAHAVRHALGCMLARVAGRSPLEYLDADARRKQRDAVVRLMKQPPDRVSDLAAAVLAGLEAE
jgi:hypothetical protein